jgi:hypothetical protein
MALGGGGGDLGLRGRSRIRLNLFSSQVLVGYCVRCGWPGCERWVSPQSFGGTDRGNGKVSLVGRVLGVSKGTQEMVACPDYQHDRFAGCSDLFEPRFGGGTLYLYALLVSGHR